MKERKCHYFDIVILKDKLVRYAVVKVGPAIRPSELNGFGKRYETPESQQGAKLRRASGENENEFT